MKRSFRVEFAPAVADVVRSLPPDVKRQVKSALRLIAEDPDVGVPLMRELRGLRKYRVRRFRIVYETPRRKRVVRVVAVGHRRSVYDDLAAARRPPT